jgi:hypothetical protein
MDLTRQPLPALDDTDALDATLADEDWPLVLDLWRSGVTNAGIYRLLRLRCVYRRRGDPALDGFCVDAKVVFMRWLVQQGRLHDGA